jgi:hypothetical protein
MEENTSTIDAETLQRLMRPIRHHQAVSKCLTDSCRVFSVDEVGPGNAHHKYQIHCDQKEGGFVVGLNFQNGAIKEVGDINGIPDEALYAVLIDRLQGFQSGPFSCRENAIALTKLEESLMWLQKRTRDRQLRGVEGLHQK